MEKITRNETIIIILMTFVVGTFASYVLSNFAYHTKPNTVILTTAGSSKTTGVNVVTADGNSPIPNTCQTTAACNTGCSSRVARTLC